MKSIYLLTTVFLILFSSCTSEKRVKVKSCPVEGFWYKCPRCEGTGLIKHYHYEKTPKYGERSPSQKNRESAMRGFCFLGLFFADFGEMREERKGVDEAEEFYVKDADIYTERIRRAEKIECPKCRGLGWIRKFDKKKLRILNERKESVDELEGIIRNSEKLGKSYR